MNPRQNPAQDWTDHDIETGAVIVWLGKLRPTYPMFWRAYLVGLVLASAVIFIFFAMLKAVVAAVVICCVMWLLIGGCYLYAAWLTHRPKGGPECLFAVTPDGAHYHAGAELRNLGGPVVQFGAAATGNLDQLLMLKGMQGHNDLFLPWADVRNIEIMPRIHLVCVTRGWRGGVPLFCTPENFAQVRAYALARAPQARVFEPAPAAHKAPEHSSPCDNDFRAGQ